MYGQPSLLQTIPIYAYVGLNLVADSDFDAEVRFINWESSCCYEPVKPSDMQGSQPASSWEGWQYIKPSLIYWSDRLKRLNIRFKLKVWCEIPSKCGLNSSGAISTALSLALKLAELYHRSNQDLAGFKTRMVSWNQKGVIELKKDSYFEEVFRLGWVLEDCFHGFRSSGMGPFSSLSGSPEHWSLTGFLTQEKGYGRDLGIKRPSGSDVTPGDFSGVHSEINKIDYWGNRITLDSWIQSHVGVLAVYTHNYKNTGLLLENLEKVFDMTDSEMKSMVPETYSPELSKDNNWTLLSNPISDLSNPDRRPKNHAELHSKQIINQVYGLLTFYVTKAIKQRDIFSLTEAVNKAYDFLKLYGATTKDTDKCRDFILRQVPAAGVKLTGAGGGGDLVVIGEKTAVEALAARIKKKYSVHYVTGRFPWKACVGVEKVPSGRRMKGKREVYPLIVNGKPEEVDAGKLRKLKEDVEYLVFVDLVEEELYVRGKQLPNPQQTLLRYLALFLEKYSEGKISYNFICKVIYNKTRSKSLTNTIQNYVIRYIWPLDPDFKKLIVPFPGVGYKFCTSFNCAVRPPQLPFSQSK